jgi:hypothetical protein
MTPRTLAFAITLAVAPGAALAQSSADVCPLGAFTCPVVKNDFALCKQNDLLNFYQPGLPTEGDREASQACPPRVTAKPARHRSTATGFPVPTATFTT